MAKANGQMSTRFSERIRSRKAILCPICKGPSNDEMVQCNKCERWHHHVCVGLTEEIARELPSWHCNSCQQNVTSVGNSILDSLFFEQMGASSTMVTTQNQTVFFNEDTLRPPNYEHGNVGSGARVTSSNIKSSRIQDQMQLKSEIDQLTAKLNRFMNEDKVKLRQNEKSVYSQQQKVHNKPTTNTSISHHSNQSNRMSLLAEKERLINMQIEVITEKLKHAENELLEESKLIGSRQEYGAIPRQFNAPLHNNPSLKQAENQFIPSSVHGDQRASTSESSVHDSIKEEVQLNINHWMARQTVRPLPIYDGKPDEWPMFFSAFERSTKLCGFSNEENLDRLQSALRGVARQLVEGQFYLPECVPKIMEQLKQSFGRPNQMLHVYLQKLKKDPPPQNDKPETLMQFAMTVRNLWAMMEATNMQTHMNNPQMLQDLVDKLPLSMRYQWASHIVNLPGYDDMVTFIMVGPSCKKDHFNPAYY